MIVSEMKFGSYEEFYNEVFSMNCIKEKYRNFVFRGVVSSNYSLLPSALREGYFQSQFYSLGQAINIGGSRTNLISQIEAEFQILKRFYIAANENGLELPKSDSLEKAYLDANRMKMILQIVGKKGKWFFEDIIEIAALAQHYGLPTRMLDFTFDINVALYFASRGPYENLSNDKGWLAIWALGYLSDRFIPQFASKIPLEFIVPRYANNPNLNAQKGLFVYWETEFDFSNVAKIGDVDRTPIEEHLLAYDKPDHEVILYKFLIPKSEMLKIANCMAAQGYTAARLFPGYQGVARMLIEQDYLRQASIKKSKIP